MSRCEKLLRKAQQTPGGLRYEEVCYLAECFGFVFDRQKGSHRIYKRNGFPRVMNFQNDNGKAKLYQVPQLLAAIEGLPALEDEDDREDNR